uniref:Uncharacterized protein n=1 Tax=viral metagenome TaxID=1070528 RepID=A0A6C0CBC8_9ZZZZ
MYNPPISVVCEYTHKNIIIKDFQITTHPTKDIYHLEALSTGKQLEWNDILDISVSHKFYIFNSFKKNIDELRKCDIKFVCVIDITDFPIIKGFIDDSDMRNSKSNSLFDSHLAILWNNYSIDHVITVTTNIHRSHIDVQLLPFICTSLNVTQPIYINEAPTRTVHYDEIPSLSRFGLSELTNRLFDPIPLSSFISNELP